MQIDPSIRRSALCVSEFLLAKPGLATGQLAFLQFLCMRWMLDVPSAAIVCVIAGALVAGRTSTHGNLHALSGYWQVSIRFRACGHFYFCSIHQMSVGCR